MTTQRCLTLEHLREEAESRVPPLDGVLTAKGLEGPVRVIQDRHGVPHADVGLVHEMWFVQGILHAQERLWAMERTRRFSWLLNGCSGTGHAFNFS